MHRVLESLDGAGEVLEGTPAHRHGHVGLLHAADDLSVETLAKGRESGDRGLRVGVLGLEVPEHGRVLAVAQPVPRIDTLVAVVAQDDGARGREWWPQGLGHGRILADAPSRQRRASAPQVPCGAASEPRVSARSTTIESGVWPRERQGSERSERAESVGAIDED